MYWEFKDTEEGNEQQIVKYGNYDKNELNDFKQDSSNCNRPLKIEYSKHRMM